MVQLRSRRSEPATLTGRPAAPTAAPKPTAEPRAATAWAAGLYALCTLALMYPALGGAFLVSPHSDQYITGYAFREFGATALKATGHVALWDPYLLGGLPYVAAFHGDIFYPSFLLRLVLPTDVAMTWSFGVHLFLAGLFAYVFLRAWGFPFFPALLGGVAYLLSGQIASLVSPGHDGKLYVSALAPLLLWAIVRGVRDGKVWAWGVIAIATGLCVLSPQLQLTYYTGLLAIGFTLWLAFRRGEDGRSRLPQRVALTRLACAAGGALVGLCIGAVQFLPFFQYMPFAARGTAKGWEYATSYSMPPEELINAYLPQFSGFLETYWGRNFFKLHSDYLGASVLVLAGAAFGSKLRRGFVRFWFVAGIVALLVALGGYTPFYRAWYLLPMMKVLRAPSMIYFIVSLATAFLAAVGLERLLMGEWRQRYILGWGIAALAIAILASVGFFQALGSAVALPGREDALAADAGHMIAGAWRSALFVGLLLGAVWLFRMGRLPAAATAWAIALVAALDLWSIDRQYFTFSPPASVLYAADPAVEYLKRLKEPARTIAFPLSEQMAPNDPFLTGSALMTHRIRTATGHHGNEPQAWVDLAGAKSPAYDPQRLLDPQFRRLANVKYLYTNAEIPREIPQLPGVTFTKLVGPVRNAAGTTVYLYELNGDAPAAWVAPVIVKAAREPTLATVLDPRFDPKRAAIFDSAASVPAVAISALPEPSPVTASVTRYEPGRISVSLDRPAPAGSALLVSENYIEGWRATVNGKEVPIGRADYTFIGVALPAGARGVELSFEEPSYERGKAITLVALAASVAVIVAGSVLGLRARRGAA